MGSLSSTVPQQNTTVRLRILATSDLHMNLQAFDYVTDTVTSKGGLTRLAKVISDARAEAKAKGALTLLFDNGDTLQGNALGDLLARTPAHPNPVVQAMNALHYDAVGLGNHDFDHGLEYLSAAMRDFNMPVLSCNVSCSALPDLRSELLLSRNVRASDGTSITLKIGVLSVLPPKTADWNQNHLRGAADIADALETLRERVPRLKQAGADVVVVLAHMGIADSQSSIDQQSAALEVARISGVSAVIAGHTHVRFPDPKHPVVPNVDHKAGTLAGTPAALPGFGAEDLAVIDLTLEQKNGWAVQTQKVELRQPGNHASEDEAILNIAAPAHQATRTYLSQPVGTLRQSMHTYFALANPSPVIELVANAKKRVVAELVAGTALENLPLLAAAASPASGGISGPDHYVVLPMGTIERRHIAGLSPYGNQVWAVRVNGVQLKDWLERAAQVFQVLDPDTPDQLLLDPQVPSFRYDSIYGVTYQIDPTAPPRRGTSCICNEANSGRVRGLKWKGQAVTPEMEFLVATSHFRASGGGGFDEILNGTCVLQSEVMLGEALTHYLEGEQKDCSHSAQPWRFMPDLGVETVLETSPHALEHLNDIVHLKPEPIGTADTGFARIRLHL